MTYPPLNPQPDDSNSFAPNNGQFGGAGSAPAPQPPAFSQQPPAFGEQPPAFGEQPTQVMPAFGQPQPSPGEQPPAFGAYGQPAQAPAAQAYPQPGFASTAYSYPGFEQAPVQRSTKLGLIALLLALLAVVGASVAGAIFSLPIGEVAGKAAADNGGDLPDGLGWAIDAVDSFLHAEIVFWIGTALGITAFGLGIISAVQRRGRGMGIGAAIISGVGPVVFFATVLVVVAIGAVPYLP